MFLCCILSYNIIIASHIAETLSDRQCQAEVLRKDGEKITAARTPYIKRNSTENDPIWKKNSCCVFV